MLKPVLVFLICLIGFFAQATNPTVALLQELKRLQIKNGYTADTTQLGLLQQLSDYYLEQRKFNEALTCYNQALRNPQVINNPNKKCLLLLQISDAQNELGNYPSSEDYARQALFIAEKHGGKELFGRALNALSSVYVANGKLKQALAIDLKLYTTFRDQQTERENGVMLYNLGIDYQGLAEYETAHQYFTQAISAFKKSKDNQSTGDCYRQMAQMYLEIYDTTKATLYLTKFCNTVNLQIPQNNAAANLLQGEILEQQQLYNSALSHYQKSLSEYLKANDSFGRDYANCNITNLYVLRKEYEQAIRHAEQVLPFIAQMHTTLVVVLYPALGAAYYKKKQPNFALAERYIRLGLDLAITSNITTDVQFAYTVLADMYKQKGDYRQSLHYTNEAARIKDSLVGIENTKKLNELEVKYQSAEKEQKIELMSRERGLAKAESSRQLQQRNSLFAGLGLMSIALVAGGIAYRNSRKYSKYLAREEQRKELLLQEVHHRTNNSLQLISALLTMQSEMVEDATAKGFLQQSESRIHSMSALHELLNNNATQIEVNMAEYLGNVIDFHQSLSAAGVEINSNLFNIQFPAKIALPIALITNELVTNSLKYAFTDTNIEGRIHVVLAQTEKQGEWILSVTDNGKGLPENTYQPDTGNIGSKLIQILTKQIGGKLQTSSNNGATVSILFTPKLS